MNTIYKSNNNVVYSCKYHVVWCPKYRRKVLTNGVDVRLKELLREYAVKLYYPKLLQSIFSIKKKKITSDKLSPICKHITMINRIKCNTKSRFSSNLPGTCFFS